MNHASPLTPIRSRQGPFAPPELPGFHATTTPSDSCPGPKTVINQQSGKGLEAREFLT
jgi:hypothetical protein